MNTKIIVIAATILSGAINFLSADTGNDSKLFPISQFGEGFPQPGSLKTGFIDEKGTVVMTPTADFMPPHHFKDNAYFVDGLEPVQVGLKTKWRPLSWGYLDTKFNFVIEPQFGLAFPFSEGLASVRDKGGYGYIDHTGKYVIEPQFEEASPFLDGLAAVKNTTDHLMGFIGPDGKWAIQPIYQAASPFSDGLACVTRKMTPEEIEARKGKNPFSNQFLRGYINKSGKQVIDFKFLDSDSFSDGLAAVNDPDAAGYIDKTGAYVFPQDFFMVWPFSEGLARVKTKDGKMSYINPKGEVVFTVPGLAWADPFSEGLADAALMEKPGKRIYGYLDHTGNFAITPQFQMATPFSNGLAQVALNGEAGFIDKTGNLVWKCKIPAMPW